MGSFISIDRTLTLTKDARAWQGSSALRRGLSLLLELSLAPSAKPPGFTHDNSWNDIAISGDFDHLPAT